MRCPREGAVVCARRDGVGDCGVRDVTVLFTAARSTRTQRQDRWSFARDPAIDRAFGTRCCGYQGVGAALDFLDCDVLNADGGTRCASICGSYVALVLAVRALEKRGVLDSRKVLVDEVAAVSVGYCGRASRAGLGL